MNLKDFRPDIPDFKEEDLQEKKYNMGGESPVHQPEIHDIQDIHHIKIEKLSSRVTIFSIILPCIMAVIIIFAYLDLRGKLADADLNKKNQAEKLSQQFQEQLGAMDVKIEKNRFDLEAMDKKIVGMEGQIAKLTTSKADNASITEKLTKLDAQVTNNTNQNKLNLQTIERVNKEFATAQTGMQSELDKNIKNTKEEISAFKKELDAKLAGIGEVQRDLSLMDKKLKKMEQDGLSQTKLDEKIKFLREELNANTAKLDKQVQNLELKLTTNVSRLQKDIDALINNSSPAPQKAPLSEPVKPKPQGNTDPSTPTTIKQKSLTD